MAAIQSRFEVAVPELPDHIDPASYSTCSSAFFACLDAEVVFSDVLITEHHGRARSLSLSRCPAFCVVAYLAPLVTVLFDSIHHAPLQWMLLACNELRAKTAPSPVVNFDLNTSTASQ